MKEKRYARMLSALLLFLGGLICFYPSKKEQMLQSEIAEQVLRFHVLANSDSPEDQEEKLQVKAAVLQALSPLLANAASRQDTCQIIQYHMDQIGRCAQDAAGQHDVRVSLETAWFPQKTYGDYTFPEGSYRTLQIRIGEAGGHNWWCVLFPGLCFADAVHPVVTEEGAEELEQLLDEDAFDFLLHPAKTKIRFRWF